MRESVKGIMKQTEEYRRKQTDVNKEISKLKASDAESVSKGVFGGKVSKAERQKELDGQLLKATDNLDALTKIRGIVYNILNLIEFPRIVVVFG